MIKGHDKATLALEKGNVLLTLGLRLARRPDLEIVTHQAQSLEQVG